MGGDPSVFMVDMRILRIFSPWLNLWDIFVNITDVWISFCVNFITIKKLIDDRKPIDDGEWIKVDPRNYGCKIQLHEIL